ncbi:MAG: plasmid pRiA4b ORF-3 family protein [Desulfopila sp.]
MTIIRPDFRQKKGSGGQGEEKEKEKSIQGFRLRLILSFSDPSIWRRIEVPGTLSLAGLHGVVQRCFDWQDTATYRFLVGKIFYRPDPDGGDRSSRSTTAQLHEIEKDMTFIFSYIYDGGSGWECEITVEEVLSTGPKILHPLVIDGQGASPPDVFDDIHAYQEMITALDGPTANRWTVLRQFEVSSSFDPATVDIPAINKKIQHFH